MTEKYKLALEIHRLFEDHRGSFSSISGYLGRNDSGKISRQLSPSDDSRDNPYTEIVDIHAALISFAPQLEEKVWQILERERGKLRKDSPSRAVHIAELINKVFPELGDVVFCCNTNASQEEKEREAFQLLKAVEAVYQEIKKEGERK
jgi:hypothetical protein